MPHVGLSEHDNLNSVSSQCARGKLSTARKPEIHQKKKKKKKKKDWVDVLVDLIFAGRTCHFVCSAAAHM